MNASWIVFTSLILAQAAPLGSGDHKRTITVDGLKRVHWIHVPKSYDPKKPMPVVLALHGALMDAKMMEAFSGLSSAADQHHFIVVYPNGTGPGGIFQTWNAGVFPGTLNKQRADDVKYISHVIDDVSSVLNVDKKRIYVAGLSNGGMMAYRLAAELSDRIAAIAAVGGTLALEKYEPKRPVPVIHFHGTKDTLVPFNGFEKKKETPAFMRFRSVDDTIMACVKANGCNPKPIVTEVDAKEPNLKIIRKEYVGPKKNGADVVLYEIVGGGHTWPGQWAPAILGPYTRNFSANDVMWEFFKQHPMK